MAYYQQRPPYQETLATDVLVDKLLKARTPSHEIVKTVNNIMSSKRKINDTYISERLAKIAKFQEQLGKLLRLPKIEQRSQEWHDLRKGIVTASEFAQALGKAKFGNQKQYFQRKCGYEHIPFNPGEPPLKWGTMYEDVAVDIYKHRFGYDFHEFGILPHPSVKHFGASPDGINDFGIMVEIKCPFRRKINFSVVEQYYLQIQGQLSVCDLQECDFVECELDEYGDLETWAEVGHEEKGIVIERETGDALNPWVYEYSPLFMATDNPSEQQEIVAKATHWLDTHIKDGEKDSVVLHFWTLRVFNCLRVYRDDNFINERFQELQPVWDKVTEYRTDHDKYKADIMPTRARAASTKTPAFNVLEHAPSAPPALPCIPLPPSKRTLLGHSNTFSGYSFLDDGE